MIINQSNLSILYTGYRAAFQGGLSTVKPTWEKIATEVPSSTRTEKYGWLGRMPAMREWIGDRVFNNVSSHDYSITNKSYESTVAVDRDDIQDDTYGVFAPLMTELGRSTAVFPDELIYGVMVKGFTEKCYDGKPMFAADHPVINDKGKEVAVSNMQAGNAAPWFLLDISRTLRPFIFQKRQAFEFVAKTDPKTSDDVFNTKQFVYGVDGRCNVGYGFWQMAFGSKAPLTQENLRAARRAMMEMKGDGGRPLGVTPNLIVVGPSNGDAARDILLRDMLPGGGSNADRGLFEIHETPWLA